MEQQMPPQEPPKQITSMGSVFGTPMTGFALVNQGAATPPTAERTAAIMPTDVLTQDVMTLKVEVKELRNLVDQMKEEIKVIVHQNIKNDPEYCPNAVYGTGLDPTEKPVEKKKRGRPKKVVA